MLTSLWIATQESSCAYQVMFHPDDAMSPRDAFAVVSVFKPEQGLPPYVSKTARCPYDDAQLILLASEAYVSEGDCQGS